MKIFRFLLALLYVSPLFAQKISELPELNNPASITMDSSTIYICDRDCIQLYNLKPFHYLKKIGRSGEGPGEFNSPPHLVIYTDRFFINTMGKIMTFAKTGEFQEQTKIPFLYWYIYYPLNQSGANYVGLPLKRIEDTGKFVHIVNIYDSQLKLIKEIYQGGSPQLLPPPRPGTKVMKQDFEVIPDCLEVAIHNDKIYVADSRKGFYIAVFSNAGDSLAEIDIDYQKVAVSKEFKHEFWTEMRADKDWEQLKQRFNYVIKDSYPAFFSMKIQQGQIFVTTYAKKDSFYEIIILDLNGKILNRAYSFPLNPENRLLRGIAPYSNEYAIHDNKVYYLVFNEDSMLYELHVKTI